MAKDTLAERCWHAGCLCDAFLPALNPRVCMECAHPSGEHGVGVPAEDHYPAKRRFAPLDPVTPGHTLVIPKEHVREAGGAGMSDAGTSQTLPEDLAIWADHVEICDKCQSVIGRDGDPTELCSRGFRLWMRAQEWVRRAQHAS